MAFLLAPGKRLSLFGVLAAVPSFGILVFGKTAELTNGLPFGKWTFIFAWILVCLLLYRLTAPRNVLSDLPQPPKPTSRIGHARKILFSIPKGDQFLDWMEDIPNSGLIYYDLFPFGIGKSVMVTSAEALTEVLISKSYDFEKVYGDRMLLQSFIGRGLITVEGTEHKMQRKSVTPAFSGKHINDLIVPAFWTKSKELADVIASKLHISPSAKGNTERTGVVDLNQWASHVTLDIIGLACVGKDFGSIYNADDELVKTYETLFKADEKRGMAVFYEVLSIFLPPRLARVFPFFKQVREAAIAKQRLRVLCLELLAAKRRDMETESTKHIDILSVLIRSGQFTDNGLVDQLLTFLAAGHETTAGAFIWTMHLLAINPSIQERLRHELRSHFTLGDQNAQVSSLDSLPYLNAIINEQLRLMPIVPTTGRTPVKDTTILGHPIPKGTTVITAPWAINRSKTYWGPDAREFKPERWLQENMGEGKKSIMSVITFLHGPRSCIGQAFSRAELRCLITAMILKFDVKMADPTEAVEPDGLVTIKPKNGMRLLLSELPV